MKVKKTLVNIVTVLSLAFTPIVSKAQTECIVPSDGMNLIQDTVLCTGTYNLPNGINVTANDVTLDCNGASLVGSGISNGIEVRGYKGVTVRNCNVSSYDDGIVFIETDNSVIEDNVAQGNRDGILHHNATFISYSGIVRRNKVHGSGALGIFLQRLDGNQIYDNEITNSGYGIYSWYMDNSFVDNNKVDGNSQNVILASSFNNKLTNNEVNGSRLWLNNESAGNKIYSNDFRGVGVANSLLDRNIFCVNNVGNNYYEGAIGPGCHPCESDWECNSHGGCIGGVQQCNSVIDRNSCGVPYNGDYSEFNLLSCDDDKDGVLNESDLCPGTSIPELRVPTERLNQKRYTLTRKEYDENGYAIFSSANKNNQPSNVYTTGNTSGCSCEQILDALRRDAGSSEYKLGCKENTLEDWISRF